MKTIVQSKLIKSIYYQADSRALDVNFHNGKTRVYYEVPADTVNNLLSSTSPGWYYNCHIKGSYPEQ
ncbi:KTSC domain-containing protein [Agrobacterium cavarae]|uniref:KTSC domain-containing protein n=1 Tax=Agrobacterium cavarae TaxID=2528239 RepID=UPI0035E445AD